MSPLIQRGRRWLVPVLALLILVGGFVGVAMSGGGSGNPAPRDRNGGVRLLEHFADELGVSEEELLAAAQRAAAATLDDLVDQRLLTREQAGIVRDRIERAVQNPDALRRILRSLRREAAPYEALVKEVRGEVERAIADELGVGTSRLESLARRDAFPRALRRAGVTNSELRSIVRRAAADPLRDAVSDGLITRRQARIALRKTVAFVDHHF